MLPPPPVFVAACSRQPSGKYVMEDVQKYGGTPAVMKYMLENGMLHGDCLTVTGKTIAENLANIKSISPGKLADEGGWVSGWISVFLDE